MEGSVDYVELPQPGTSTESNDKIDSAIGSGTKHGNPSSELEQLERERDELQKWFNRVKQCCENEGDILEEQLQTESAEERSRVPALIFNRESTELNQLKVAVQVLKDLTADDEKDIKVFENVWKCVLPWFHRNRVAPEADALLDAFMTRLYPLLSAPSIADVMQKYFDQLINLPYPDALIELCRNSEFARKVHAELVKRFVEALKGLEFQSNGANARTPVDSEEKWRCVRLGNLTVDILRASAADTDDFYAKLLQELTDTDVHPEEMTISFYRGKVLQILRSKCKAHGDQP